MTRNPKLRRTVALLLPCLLLAALPASGLLGSLSGIASEISQIVNIATNALTAAETAVSAIETANTVLELQDQIDQQLDDAMGRIGALVDSFEDLTSDPMKLLENAQGLTWAGDFQGQPRQLLDAAANMQDNTANSLLTYARQDLAAIDTVSRQRYARTFPDTDASANYLARRESADRQLATDFLVLDSAEQTIELLGSAADSIDRSRQQTNLSDTALAQEGHALLLNALELDTAHLQLVAQHTLRNGLETYKLEREHRAQIEAWVTAERAEARLADRAQNRIRGQRNAWRQAFLLD